MRNKKTGFTLIELLIVIIFMVSILLIGVVAVSLAIWLLL